jgi:hypothetical protein
MFASKGLFDDDGEVDVDSRSHAAQQNARPMASRTGQPPTNSRAAEQRMRACRSSIESAALVNASSYVFMRAVTRSLLLHQCPCSLRVPNRMVLR